MSSTLSQPRAEGHEDAAGGAALTSRLRETRPRLWRKRWPVLCVAAVAVLALAPAMLRGVPSNIDLWNHYRLALPLYDAVRGGDLSPGWLAESSGGYGDPSFRFYPPGAYYLLGATRALTGDWYSGSLVAFTLLSILGGLGVYFWARASLTRQQAMWAGVLYTLMPYHVNELYQAFMLPEYAGAAILPFCFAFVERICRRKERRDVVGLAVSFAALVVTHLPLTVIGGLSLLAYALLRMERGKRVATVLRLAAGAALGLAATAFYWVTMLAELTWVRTNTTQADLSVDYRFNFLFQTFSPENMNVWWMNFIAFATLALVLPGAALFARGRVKRRGVRVAGLLFLLAFFMATPLSRPLWAILWPLREVQFPWRWLAIVSMAGSVVAASTFHFWTEKAHGRGRPLALLVAGGVVVSLTLTFSHVVREARYLSPEQFETTLRSIPGTPNVEYWATVWAVQPLREMSGQVEAAQRTVNINSWEPERRTFEVGPGARTEARVRTFYYPHWRATANGQALPVRAADDGVLLISLPADAVAVELEFREPARSRVAAATSAVGAVLIGGLFVFGGRKRKREGDRR
ncbi:MAG TPA: 6-pyruvoyl-tetrahydropterin synthase-related protein [Pyrinomonadaceae bacterium]|nr:6-pyruvoyl-tetrahydropterin synthase-related protein [Pyrinomonadaceae bacterium]